MSEEKKLALLIDSDNVSAKYAQFILQEASKHGELIYKRIYGDWEKNNTGWRIPAMNNSIMPVQQNSYIAGKNATDFSMIIDAMDILYTGSVDGFVLVTSDSDFTRLAIRLREAGKLVVGIGEVKTPLAFTSSCHHFSYLNQVCDNLGDYDEKTLRRTVLDYVKENDDGRLDLSKINAFLASSYGNVDFNAIGFNRLSAFIDSFPELRRNSNFVTLKKQDRALKSKTPAVNAPGEKEIANVIVEYLKRQNGGRDDLSKVTEYVTKVLGKIDFSRFGSKRFAKFIDNQPVLCRKNNTVELASKQAKAAAKPAEGNEKTPKPSEQKPAEAPAKAVMHISSQIFTMEVRKYAAENMPGGGNLGQLNNMLLEKYGKNYIGEMEFSDFAAAMNSVSGVKVEKNRVFDIKNEKASQKAEATKSSSKTAEKSVKKPVEKTVKKAKTDSEEPVLDIEEPEIVPQKPEINAVKRDILLFAAQNKSSGSLAVLGGFLTKKYGRGYLKELGFTTMKKLIASINGISEKNNILLIDEEFLQRTEEIEQFIYDFARNDSSRSIKSLSSKIRKSFEGFDFTDYGYARFSDFINAIDGVRANGYYVEPVD